MLLLDVMRGDATLFIRGDEAEAQWRLITPIEEAWANDGLPKLADLRSGQRRPSRSR